MNKATSESGKALEIGGASILKRAIHLEGAEATGEYQFKIIKPYEELREKYIKLRDKSFELKARLVNCPALARNYFEDQLGKTLEAMAKMVYVAEKGGFSNLVTTVGKNFALDTYLDGSGFTAAWYLGLVDDTPTFNAADTMSSHAGWTENTNYSEGSRPTAAFSSAASGSKAFSAPLDFSINAASQTIAGCFLTTVATKGGTTGTLYSAGAFTGGDKSVTSGDTLQVSYSTSL